MLLSARTRIRILSRLRTGPASVGELVQLFSTTQSNVSNHLALLRAAGVVQRTRAGRVVEYRLIHGAAEPVIDALGGLVERPAVERDRGALATARTCYDHLAGRLGVNLFDTLLAAGAIAEPRGPKADVELGRQASATFESLGLPAIPRQSGRRRFAYGCLDWTERRYHLGGVLGAAIAERFLDAGWVVRASSGRALRVKPSAWRAVDRLGSA